MNNILIGGIALSIIISLAIYYILNKRMKNEISLLKSTIKELSKPTIEKNNYNDLKEQYDTYVKSNNFDDLDEIPENIKNEINKLSSEKTIDNKDKINDWHSNLKSPHETIGINLEETKGNNLKENIVSNLEQKINKDTNLNTYNTEYIEDYLDTQDEKPIETHESPNLEENNDEIETHETSNLEENFEEYIETHETSNLEEYIETHETPNLEENIEENIEKNIEEIETHETPNLEENIENIENIEEIETHESQNLEENIETNLEVIDHLKFNNYEKYSLEDLNSLTVKELQDIAKKNKLKVRGKKDELLQRVKSLYNLNTNLKYYIYI